MKPHYNSLKEFINNYQSDIVHFCVANKGGSKLAINLAKSCKRNNIPLVFFGQDLESLNKLRKYAITVNNIEDNEFRLDICRGFSSNFALYGTERFKKVTWLRYELCKAILNSNRTPIYLDIDIVVKHNYESDIMKYFSREKNLDAVFQKKLENQICAGFFALNKNSKEKISKIFSENFLAENNYRTLEHDETFINEVVLKINNELLNVKKLPKDNYPTGDWWYQNHKLISDKTMLVHYSHRIGQDRKILRMVRHLDYFSYDYHNLFIYFLKYLLNKVMYKFKKIYYDYST